MLVMRVIMPKTKFTWKYANCHDIVKLYCSYNNFSAPYDMYYDNMRKYHIIELNLSIGTYQYKFMVNNIWMYNLQHPIIIDENNNINNYVIVEPDNIINIVHISDTHSIYNADLIGDILVHSGDFSIGGHPEEYRIFNEWLGGLNFKYKLVVLGNHDLDYFNDNNINPYEKAVELLTNATVLNFTGTKIYGINFYGNPWYLAHNWNNTYKENSYPILFEYSIPHNTDILITHSPAHTQHDEYNGSKILFENIKCVQPIAHLFGHIHQMYGHTEYTWHNNKITYFINSALVTQNSERIINPPHCIKYDLITKTIISVGKY
jgi:Icc-related predicted phosphoesterase